MNNKRKTEKRLWKTINSGLLIRILIPVFVILAIYIFYTTNFSPFQTQEEKQVKPIYKAAMKGVYDFRLRTVRVDEVNNSVQFNLRLKNRTNGSNDYTEKQLHSINLAVEQLVEYLNESKSLDSLYSSYVLHFNIGNTPIYVICDVSRQDNQFEFSYLGNYTSNIITDFYMMKDVRLIGSNGCFVYHIEEEKVRIFSEFYNLNKINFRPPLEEEKVIEFVEIMREINPSCKIFIENEEIVLSD